MHKFLFYNKFIIFFYMFRAMCAHHQEVKIVLNSIWYHHTEGSELSKINNNNNNNICLLQLGCHPVAVVILHVYKI